MQMVKLEWNSLPNIYGLYVYNDLFGYNMLLVVLVQFPDTIFYNKNCFGMYY